MPQLDFCIFALSAGMKSQKSPPAYVLDHRNGLKRHAMTPFAFADRYDPKQALEYTQCVSKIFFQKKILDHQSQEDHPPKLSFWRSTMQFCIKIEKSP